MKMSKLSKVALSSLLGLTLLAGCGGSGGRADGEVIVNLASEPPKMTSFLNTDSTSGNVLRHTVEGLTSLDANDKVIPGVAKEWTQSDDKLTYTFKLREDAKWNNGEPVTAHDFKYGWDQLFTTANGANYASTWAVYVEGAEALMAATKDATKLDSAEAKAAYENVGYKVIDDYTFEVKFTGPYPYVLDLMAFYSFAPINQKFYEEKGTAIGDSGTYGKEFDTILYNGPFVMTAWTHEDSIVLEKNDNYWNKDVTKLNKITFKMIDNTGSALNEFENGDIDMIALSGEQAKDYREKGEDVKEFDDGSVWYFEFNTKVKPFNNAKVRKALTLGVNVDEYVEAVVMNNSKAAQTLTAPAVKNGAFTDYVGNVFERSTDYSAAKALLEEGLAEEGMTLADFKPELLGDQGDTGKRSYEFYQEQWKTNLGFEATITQVEFKTRIDRMQKGEFDIVNAGWSLDYNDPMSYLDLLLTDGGNNHGKYSNPVYDEIIGKAYMEADPAVRDDLLKQAEEIIAEDMPFGVVYYRTRDYITTPRLKGESRSAFRDIDLRFAETVAE